MKKLLFLSFLLFSLFFCQKGFSQKLTDPGNFWYTEDHSSGPTVYIYRFAGADTMINNKTYTIFDVYTSYYGYNFNDYSRDICRYDSSGKFSCLGSFEIEFDFTLDVGDPFSINSNCTLWVTGKDSVTIQNGERRLRLTLMGPNSKGDSWIEGMGSTTEGFQANHNRLHCSSGTPLNFYRFCNNGISLWGNDGPCGLTPIEKSNLAKGISIYPNPASDQLIIENIHPGYQTDQIIIYGGKGERINSYAAQLDKTILPINTLHSGMYYVFIKMKNGGYASQKFMKK